MTHEHHGPRLAAVRFRNRRAAASALLALAAITLAAGCSSSGGTKADSSPTPSSAQPTETVSADEAQARKAVIAAYQGMTDETVKAYAKSSLAGSNITKYATGKALRDVKDAVFIDMRNGIVSKGEPKVIAGEDDVSLGPGGGEAQRATLHVCFDMNTWEPINKRTGKSVSPPDQVKRYIITAHLQKQANQWRVTDEKANKERPC
ncbi:hypothetical protein OG985_48370 [Streptomyces sp. NBC_00289]|uniref:hypothetical protein n=1 Tax=Streptomyces sp. NBC_00289 TaxID=2975703 RepID=UPI00325365EE